MQTSQHSGNRHPDSFGGALSVPSLPNPVRPTSLAVFGEMMRAVDVIGGYGAVPEFLNRTTPLADCARRTGGITFIGEGSSLALPPNLFRHASRLFGGRIQFECFGGRQALSYSYTAEDLPPVVFISNSGSSDSVVKAKQSIGQTAPRDKLFSITAFDGLGRKNGQSYIVDGCGPDQKLVLACGKENAVPATVTAVESTLLTLSVATHLSGMTQDLRLSLCRLADDIDALIRARPDGKAVELLARKVGAIYVCGDNTGTGEEVFVKVPEFTDRKAILCDGDYAIHGAINGMRETDLLLLLAPPPERQSKIKQQILDRRLTDRPEVLVVDEHSNQYRWPQIKLPPNPVSGKIGEVLQEIRLLIATWPVFAAAACQLGINPDIERPGSATKKGDPGLDLFPEDSASRGSAVKHGPRGAKRGVSSRSTRKKT